MTRPYLLHQLLEASADARGDAPAVVDRDRTITYGDLERRSNRLAHLLEELGVQRGDRVGLYLDKSLESVLGAYGIMKAGAAYVPLDPQAPPSRVGYICGDCDIRVLLTEKGKAESWSGVREIAGRPEALVVLDADDAAPGDAPEGMLVAGPAEIDARPETRPRPATISLDLAYILYTSGSTGDPKGVMLTHANALAFVHWAVDEFGVDGGDRLSSHAPLHFDLSVFDLFAAAEAAAPVVLVPHGTSVFPVELARFIERERITVWYSVPSALTALTLRGNLEPGAWPELRTILFAGEVFPTKYLRQLMRLLPRVRFANLYGPTETNVCTWYEVPPLADEMVEPISIGVAIDDVEVFAVTDDGRPAAHGETGELYVRGPTVMRGYWGDPERTGRSLVPHPFRTDVSDPVYRTGDLVEEMGDGNLRFLGRRDAQVKSRGYRIELGDVETAIYAHPDVVECAVVAVPDDLVTNRLKAFVVARGDLDEAGLTRICAERIPRYMVPETFELRDALPKTSTGKIDRQSLLAEATG